MTQVFLTFAPYACILSTPQFLNSMKKSTFFNFLSKTSVFSLVCSLALCSNAAYAQTCSNGVCTGNVTLNSAEDITADIRAARRIVGNLTIGNDDRGTSITNDELARLQVDTITGNLVIDETELTSLDAFNSLRHVGGNLDIGGDNLNEGNLRLVSLSGFDELESIGGRLFVSRNTSLPTFAGFGKLNRIGGQLNIFGNNVLSSLARFDALRHIGALLGERIHPISIFSNSALSTCCGIFAFAQSPLLFGYTLGGSGRLSVSINSQGCGSVGEVIGNTGCSINGRTIIGDVTLDSLEAITEVIQNVTRIHGNLKIGDGSSGTDLTNAHLATLQVDTITGTLEINGTRMTSLNAFSSLRYVGYDLLIRNNDALASVSGFGALETVSNSLIINHNPILTSVSGFTALETVGVSLGIISNDDLMSLSGFDRLEIVGGFLRIDNSPALMSVSGFGALRSIRGDLLIENNTALSTCCILYPFVQSPLPDGYTVGGDITISGNGANCATEDDISATGECHTVLVRPAVVSVSAGAEENDSIPISISGDLSTAAFVIDTEGGATAWTATENPDEAIITAVTASGNDRDTLKLAFSANTTTSSRMVGTISLSTTGAGTAITKTLVVTQAAMGVTVDVVLIGDVVLDSAEDITDVVENAISIENLIIGDSTTQTGIGTSITNTHLQDISVDTITGHLRIRGTELTTLNAFNSLRHVGGNLEIGGDNLNEGNLSLVSLSGFDELESIGGRLFVSRNTSLPTIAGFGKLSRIGGQLNIFGNNVLSSLADFTALRHIGALLDARTPPISIFSNSALSTCCGVFAFTQEPLPDGYTLGGSGRPRIFINAPGCFSANEIRESTGCPLTISTDVTLNSIEDITNTIRIATRIEGNLTIGDGSTGTDLTNAHLAELQVDTITGDLTISGTKLARLDAFFALRHVGGNFLIGGFTASSDNPSLTTVSGFNTLESVGGFMTVGHNTALTTATGFERLDSTGSSTIIQYNAELRSLPDFRSLRIIGGVLEILQNAALPSVPAFPALVGVGIRSGPMTNPIFISNNPRLSMCCGLFPFTQRPLPPGFTLGASGRLDITGNILGSCSRPADIRGQECFLSVNTAANELTSLPRAEGTFEVALTFIAPTTGWVASTTEGGFVSVAALGNSPSVTIAYPANPNSLPRHDTLTIRPTGGAYSPGPRRLPLRQLGTATVVEGDITLNSEEDLTQEIRDAQYIFGDLRISDGSTGTDLENSHLAALQVEEIRGNLTISSTTLTALDAFSQLRYVEGDLTIGGASSSDGNAVLASLSGFGALDSIGGRLYVSNNVAITSLPSFSSLRSIGKALDPSTIPLTISNNAALSMCCGVFPFVQASLPPGFTLGGTGEASIADGVSGSCSNIADIRGSECFLRVNTAANELTDLPQAGGTVEVDLTFVGTTTGWEASSLSGGFVSVPASGSSPSITVTYPASPRPFLRRDTLIIRPTGGVYSSLARRLPISQLPTTVLERDVVVTSVEDIATEIGVAQYIFGNLTIGDGEIGTDIENSDLASVQVKAISGNLSIQGTSLASLDAFSSLRRIEGNFNILSNAALRSVSGFSMLDSIGGTLLIINNAELSSITAFSALDSIGGSLVIGATFGDGTSAGNPKLSSLPDFASLKYLGRSLLIQNNAELGSVSGFDMLDGVGRDLNISSNAELSSVSGLAMLENVGRSLLISNNAKLSSLPSFSLLTEVGRSLGIGGIFRDGTSAGNPMLSSLPDFASLTRVGRNLFIHNNAELSSLPSFAALTQVGLNLNIRSNDALVSVPGFAELESLEGNLFVHNNASLTSLSSFASLTRVGGYLNIRDNDMLASVSGFAELESVGGYLAIGDNALLSSLPDFAALRRVEDSLVIVNNEALTSLPSFAVLTHVGGYLNIRNNDMLASVSGFAELESVGGYLAIGSNALLSSLPDFAALRRVEDSLVIVNNEALTSLPSFAVLTHVGGYLNIRNNDILPSVSGFAELESVGGHLAIGSNALLSSLPDFASLRRVEDSLVIVNNEVLTSLPSFASLRNIGNELASEETPIIIEDNRTLSLCCGVSPFVQASLPPTYTLGGNGVPRIEGNAMGCTSEQELREACTHAISLSTTTTDVDIGAESGGTISISLPANGTEAVLMVSLSGAATSFTAEETSDDDNFVTFSVSGELLTISYSTNLDATPRMATIRLSTEGLGASITRTLSLMQRAAGTPTLSLTTSPSELTNLAADGGTVVVNIAIGGSASGWRATTEADFISLGATSGVGSESLTFTYAANETSEARSGTVTISTAGEGTPATETLTLTQVGATSHTISLSTTTAGVILGLDDGSTISISLPSNGRKVVFAIDIGAGATRWTAMETSDTENFVSAVTDMGNDGENLTISYSTNTSTSSRTATIELSTEGPGTSTNRTLSLTQRSTTSPTLSLTTAPSELTNLAAEGGTIEVSITIGGSASGWTATTEADFVSLGATSGVGSGSLRLTYAANGTTEARSGMVTISTTGGTPVTETLALTQVGATSHTISLSTTTAGVVLGLDDGSTISISLPSNGREAVFAIDIGAGATRWTAMETSDTENFVSAVTDMGGDRENLTISYSTNTSTSSRTATIGISTEGPGISTSRTLSLTQAGADLVSMLGVSHSEGGLVLYPNPASDRLHIGGLQENALVRISTIGGVIVQRTDVSLESSSIDVSDLRGGTYVVVIESTEGVLSKRLVIIQ